MQQIFKAKDEMTAYTTGKDTLYPEAPLKCPHPDCGVRVKMKKHGFYSRWLIDTRFMGKIKVRRYKCPLCGKTISMLPSWCISGFQYSINIILGILEDVASNNNVLLTARRWRRKISSLSRRHVHFYVSRIRKRQKILEFVLNEISPGKIVRTSGDTSWLKRFLSERTLHDPCEFNIRFHNITGKSFMSSEIS